MPDEQNTLATTVPFKVLRDLESLLGKLVLERETAQWINQQIQNPAYKEWEPTDNSASIRNPDNSVILLMNDQEGMDRYYQTTESLVLAFASRIIKAGEITDAIWDWWLGQVDFGEEPDKPVKNVVLYDTTLPTYFLDYSEPIESIRDWEVEEEIAALITELES